MESVLFINGCVRPESRTARLAGHVLEKLGGKAEDFFSIREVSCFLAEGLDIIGADPEAILSRIVAGIDDRMNQ